MSTCLSCNHILEITGLVYACKGSGIDLPYLAAVPSARLASHGHARWHI